VPILGFDHVQVAAPHGCEELAREFYGGLLGLPELDKPPLLAARGGCWFRAGEQQLHVGVADPFVAATKAHPGFRVGSAAELVTLAERLERADAPVSWPDEAEIPGVRRFYASDPWGNRLEFST
jgi:catechol 2,3-dioxygenase-like lactoylglutathione lyase family enzyme